MKLFGHLIKPFNFKLIYDTIQVYYNHNQTLSYLPKYLKSSLLKAVLFHFC